MGECQSRVGGAKPIPTPSSCVSWTSGTISRSASPCHADDEGFDDEVTRSPRGSDTGESHCGTFEAARSAPPHAKPTATKFVMELASIARQAPMIIAENMAGQLQQLCLEEAKLGRTTYEWEATLPCGLGDASLIEVARHLVRFVEALGFEQVEWWNGHNWCFSRGKFNIIKEPLTERHSMRARVWWAAMHPAESQTRFSIRSDTSLGSSVSSGMKESRKMLHELHRVLDLQSDMLQQAVDVHSAYMSSMYREPQALQAQSAQCMSMGSGVL